MAAFSDFVEATARPVERLRSWFPWHRLPKTPLRPITSGREPAESGNGGRPRIGIALSSGGAKGLAHIGVIQVLEENEIPVDVIAGTSIGAYVAACWASGLNGKDLEALAAEMQTSRDLWTLVDPVPWPRRGFIRGHKIEHRLRETLGDRQFSDLKVPLSIMATEYETFAPKILREGDVASAVLASLAIPGIVVPVERNMVEYVDGGVCDPLPVHVLLDDEAVDHVIAINVLPTLEEFNHSRRIPKRHGLAEHYPIWKLPLRWLNRQFNWFRRGNLLDILRSAAMASQMRVVEHAADRADVHIRPVDVHARWHDYTNYKRYIKVGREAAEKALPEIRALLGEPARVETSEKEAAK